MLLAPPPGQSASVNSQPAEDPALQKASAGRIQSGYESLTGFFETDAPGLQKMGDPSVQLALSTARSDRTRLSDEFAVLQRNPGIESTLTEDDVNSIEANLGYLQKKWRLSVNAESGLSPMPPTEEGFSGSSRSLYGWFSSFFGGTQEGYQSGSGSGSVTGSVTGSANGSVTGSVTGSATGSGSGSAKSDITLADLQDLTAKISYEIVRLGASGTTNTNTKSRIAVLTRIKQSVDDLIGDIISGVRLLVDLPITKADIKEFLPAMNNPNTRLPDLIKDLGLGSSISSLFPVYSSGDVSGADLARSLFDQYMKDIVKNLSWNVDLKYVGQAEQELGENYASAMRDARYAVDSTGTPVAGNAQTSTAASYVNGANTPYRGVFDAVVRSVTGITPTHRSTYSSGSSHSDGKDSTTHSDQDSTRGAGAPFNWKERSKEICNQINARGMKAYDFGCLKDPDTMARDNFSWRGYTRMVCTRLATVYDPSIPELCGCPPPSWIGWRP